MVSVLPRINEEVNEEWLADKSRFSYDGLKRQRLHFPMIKKPSGEYVSATWEDVRGRPRALSLCVFFLFFIVCGGIVSSSSASVGVGVSACCR